eukprot:Opistho-2@63395
MGGIEERLINADVSTRCQALCDMAGPEQIDDCDDMARPAADLISLVYIATTHMKPFDPMLVDAVRSRAHAMHTWDPMNLLKAVPMSVYRTGNGIRDHPNLYETLITLYIKAKVEWLHNSGTTISPITMDMFM